jgi:hypothetical protein
LYCEMKKDPQCVFVKVAPMTFGLKEFGLEIEASPKARSKRRKKKPPVEISTTIAPSEI